MKSLKNKLFFIRTILKILKTCFSGNYLFSYTIRPGLSKNVLINEYEKILVNTNYANVAIIIQGQILNFDFIYQTICLYKKLFNNITIILSTWSKELSPSQFSKLKSLNITIIESEVLLHSGYKNINSQIKSTLAAIDICRGSNIHYILKTRTDQRFYNINTINYLFNYYNNFKGNCTKIIGCSLNTFKQRLYCISDMFLFSDLNSMYDFWDIPYDLRSPDFLLEKCINSANSIEYSKINVCEQYLVTGYLEKCGEQIIWEESHSNKLLTKYFAIIDQSSIDLIWQKYSLKESMWRNYDGNSLSELSFSDWLNNYVNFKN